MSTASKKKGKFTGGGYAPPRLGPVPADPPQAAPAKPEPKPKPTEKKAAPAHTARLQVMVTPEADRAFRMLQVELGRKGPGLMHEALNLLLKKYGKEPV